MIQLSCLNWLLLDGLPLRVEEPIVKIDRCLTYQVVAKEQVIVISFNLQRRCAWERDIEVESLVELGTRLIVLVILLVVELHLSAAHDQVRIAM